MEEQDENNIVSQEEMTITEPEESTEDTEEIHISDDSTELTEVEALYFVIGSDGEKLYLSLEPEQYDNIREIFQLHTETVAQQKEIASDIYEFLHLTLTIGFVALFFVLIWTVIKEFA